MKLYVITKRGSKTPQRDFHGTVLFYRSKAIAKEHLSIYGDEVVRFVEVSVKEAVK